MADRFHLFLVPMKSAHGEFVKYDDLLLAQLERDDALRSTREKESELIYEQEQHEEVRNDRNKAWECISKLERKRDFWCKVSVVLAIATASLLFWIKVTS